MKTEISLWHSSHSSFSTIVLSRSISRVAFAWWSEERFRLGIRSFARVAQVHRSLDQSLDLWWSKHLNNSQNPTFICLSLFQALWPQGWSMAEPFCKLIFFSWRSVCYLLKAWGCLPKVRGLLKTCRESNCSSCFQRNVLPEPIIPFTISQHGFGSWKRSLGRKMIRINLNMPNKNQVTFKFGTTSSLECLSVCTGWKVTRVNLEGLQTCSLQLYSEDSLTRPAGLHCVSSRTGTCWTWATLMPGRG